MGKVLIGIGSLLGLFAVIGGSVWGYRHYASEKNFAEVQELRQQLFSEQSRALPKEEREQMWQRLSQGMKKLTLEQKRILFEERHAREMKSINEYFALPPEQRLAFLDAEIDRREQRMQEMRQRWAARGDGAQGGGPRRGGPPGQGDGNRGNRENSSDNSEEANNNREQRFEEFEMQMLDWTTPEDRAKWDEYWRQYSQRRQERGLSSGGGWPRF